MSHAIDRSWATHPLLYLAPHPKVYTPMDFQYGGAEYALARNHSILGDVPGLGKTIQGLLIDNAMRQEGLIRTLCIVPASLRLNWEREILRWSVCSPVPTVNTVLRAKQGISEDVDFNIVSYDMLRNPGLFRAIMKLLWDHVILDEGHFIKDYKGNARTRAITGGYEGGDFVPGIESVAGRFSLATGTLLPNQPIECYNAVRLLDWSAIDHMSVEGFRQHYYEEGGGMINTWVTEDPGGPNERRVRKLHYSDKVRNVPRNLDELQRRLRSNLMVRRLKEQVLPQLPEKQWNPVPLQIDTGIRRVLKTDGWKKAEKLWKLGRDTFDVQAPIDGDISTARREMGEAKVKQATAYIQQLLNEGRDKIVVCAWHLSVLSTLRGSLEKHGLVYMDGSTSNTKKQMAVDAFQTDPTVKIILGQMKPLGLGWTLTEAQDVVFVEPDWVPGTNDQMLDRVARIGQEGDYCLGHLLIVPDSLDERVLGSSVNKDFNNYLALDHTED